VARFSPLVVTGTFFAFALGLASGCADVPDVRPVDGLGQAEQPIINGIVDTTHQAVVFVYGNGNGCSGTVIHKDGNVAHVITAAHCGVPQQVLQGNDISNANYVYPVLDYQMHPSYTSAPLHDFMVVRIGGAGSYTAVIPAMTQSQDNLSGTTQVRHVGYGKAGPAPGTDTDLRHYYVGSLSSVQPLTISYNQLNGGPCSGDSGGPQLTLGTERVAGVTSVGDQNCNISGTSGRVSAVYDSFIMAYINNTPILPMTCEQCQQVVLNGQGACVGAVTACENHSECNALMTCINACTSSTCVQTCANQHPSGISLYNAIAGCICDTGCVSECDGEPLCQGGSSSSTSTSTSSSSTSTSGTGGAGTGGDTTSSGVGGGTTTSSGDPNADGWVAGGTEDQKYDGILLTSSCATIVAGRAAADLMWLVALGWTVAAAAHRRSRRR